MHIFIKDQQVLDEAALNALLWAIKKNYEISMTMYMPDADCSADGIFIIIKEVIDEVV